MVYMSGITRNKVINYASVYTIVLPGLKIIGVETYFIYVQEQFILACTVTKLYEPRHENTCFNHMRTTKVQISLRICAVWSAPLLFTA